MDVVPVMDLAQGQVVHGKAGLRESYKPVRSRLVNGSEPGQVASALRRHTGTGSLYLADLDAIAGGAVDLPTIAGLARAPGADLWVDAGCASPQIAKELLAAGAARVVVGSETLPGAAVLDALRAEVAERHLLLSLDLGEGGLLSPSPALAGLDPVRAIHALGAADLPRLLVLTLHRVGTSAGPDLPTLRTVRRAFPDLALVAGGGVRSVDDLTALDNLGVDAVLVATALHQGLVDAAAIEALRAQ